MGSLAGILQMLFLMYFEKNSTNHHLNLKLRIKVKFFIKTYSTFFFGVTQINICLAIIASFQAGAVSYLYYADRVYQINLAIAGIAVSIVSLPLYLEQ